MLHPKYTQKGDKMSHNDYIIDLFKLQDNTLTVTNVDTQIINGEHCIIIYVFKSRSVSNKCCIICGSVNIISHAYYLRKIKFLKIAGFNSYIYYKQRRFICKDCNRTFNETCYLVNKNANLSNAVKRMALEECRKKQSFLDIADRINISHTSVANTFNNHIGELRHKLTEIICIDEFKASTTAGKYALSIGDPVSGELLDILPSRKQDYIYYYFHSIPKEERLGVKYVVTDLFESYRTIVKTLFWHSVHIADRFHWIRLATEAFNKLRIRKMKFYKKIGDVQPKGKFNKYLTFYRIVKRFYKILITNSYNKEKGYFDQEIYVFQFKKKMSYQEIIEYIINFDNELEEGYLLLKDLYKFAKLSFFENAKKNLLDWIDKANHSENNIKEFQQVARTYYSWRKEIVNSFIINPITKSRITNGFIEGKNNFIKVIKRIGFGYKNFDTFKARILYTNDLNKPYKN